MLKCDMTTSDLEITMTNTKTPDFAFFYQTVKPVAQDTRITMKIDLDLVDKYNENTVRNTGKCLLSALRASVTMVQ